MESLGPTHVISAAAHELEIGTGHHRMSNTLSLIYTK